MEPADIFGKITQRGFELGMNDIRTLRSKYRGVSEDVTSASLNKLPRLFIINRLLTEEFGSNIMKSYRKQCDEWDMFEYEGTNGQYWFLPTEEE